LWADRPCSQLEWPTLQGACGRFSFPLSLAAMSTHFTVDDAPWRLRPKNPHNKLIIKGKTAASKNGTFNANNLLVSISVIQTLKG
jgi:hypothetical protein